MLPDSFKRVSRNSLWLLASRLTGQALSILVTLLIARSLGQAGMGQYAFMTALVFLANILTTFGTDTLLVREISAMRSTRDSSLGTALWLQLALSAAVIAALFAGAGRLPHKTPETVLALQLYSLSLIPLAFYTVFSAALRAYERMDLFMAVNSLVSSLQVASILLLLATGGRLLALALVLTTAQFAGALAAGWSCFKWLPAFKIRWRVPWAAFVTLLRQAWPLALLAGLGVIYQRLGVLWLSLSAGDAVTGWFSAAARLPEAFKILHYAYFGALFPVFSRLAFKTDRAVPPAKLARFPARLYRLSFLFLLVSAGLVALGLTLLAGPLIRLLYGPGYEPSAAALRILAWILLPYSCSARLSLELVTSGREGQVVKAAALTLAATATLYGLLIPRTGLLGASAASLAGESIQALLLWILAMEGKRARPFLSVPFWPTGIESRQPGRG